MPAQFEDLGTATGPSVPLVTGRCGEKIPLPLKHGEIGSFQTGRSTPPPGSECPPCLTRNDARSTY